MIRKRISSIEVGSVGGFDAEPVEEHEAEEQNRRDSRDLLTVAEPASIHLPLPWSIHEINRLRGTR